MKRKLTQLIGIAFAVATVAGCASRPVQAPVLERAPAAAAAPAARPPADVRPDLYTVRRGDTMFSIALDHGLDYKELAAWNNLVNPNLIRPGQQLRIKPPAGVQEAPVTVRPITSSGRVETHPLGAPAGASAAPGARAPESPATAAAPAPAISEGAIKSGPLARKLPYSPENVALLQRGDAPPAPALAPAPPPAIVPPPVAAPVPEPSVKPNAAADDEDKVDWGWPVQGKVVAGFSEATNKGLDIAAKPGSPVFAAATGRVIYNGEMRGYGKLIVIKHNVYSSVYAHSSVILVKEGQNVVKGQKIAEVGSTDTDSPKLHFEIRKLGKPVDPAKYLPPS